MKSYQFEVLDEELNKQKEKARQRDKRVAEKQKKIRLRKWVKVSLWTILVAFLSVVIYQWITITKVYTTPVGTYHCKGSIIKVCSGSKQVADYLGV